MLVPRCYRLHTREDRSKFVTTWNRSSIEARWVLMIGKRMSDKTAATPLEVARMISRPNSDFENLPHGIYL